jgi:hypothetical protein
MMRGWWTSTSSVTAAYVWIAGNTVSTVSIFAGKGIMTRLVVVVVSCIIIQGRWIVVLASFERLAAGITIWYIWVTRLIGRFGLLWWISISSVKSQDVLSNLR